MIPENEMGVIVLFARMSEDAGFEIVSIGSQFPDAVVRRTGIEYRAEFEYIASNFRMHNHDVRACDIIICWQDDFPDSILPVLALSQPGWENDSLVLPTEDKRELTYWKQRAWTAENALKNGSNNLKRRTRTPGGAIKWGNKYDFINDSARPNDLTTRQIMEMAGVDDRTARRWRAAARSGNGKGG